MNKQAVANTQAESHDGSNTILTCAQNLQTQNTCNALSWCAIIILHNVRCEEMLKRALDALEDAECEELHRRDVNVKNVVEHATNHNYVVY